MTFIRRPRTGSPGRAYNRRGAGSTLDPRYFFPELYAVWRFYDPRVQMAPQIANVPNMPGLRERALALFGDPFDLVQAAPANQPIMNPVIWGGQLPAGMFNGATSYMQCPALGAALAGSQRPLLVMLVAQIFNMGSIPFWLGTLAGAGQPVQEIFVHNATPRYRLDKLDDFGASALNLETNPSYTNARHVLGWRHTGTAETFMQDAVPLVGLINRPSAVGQCSFTQLWIGARFNGAIFLPCQMNVREIWIGSFQTNDERVIAATKYLESVNPIS